jgi:hypothetical protein
MEVQAKTSAQSLYFVKINPSVRAYVTSAESSMAEYWHTYGLVADDQSTAKPA